MLVDLFTNLLTFFRFDFSTLKENLQ